VKEDDEEEEVRKYAYNQLSSLIQTFVVFEKDSFLSLKARDRGNSIALHT